MEIRKEGVHNYLVCSFTENQYYLSTEYPVLKYNQPAYFLPIQVREVDGSRSIYFEVTGRCSLMDSGRNQGFSYEDCHRILKDFYELIKDVERYMLSLDQVSFRKDMIYINSEHHLQWMYLPQKNPQMQKDLEELFLWILSVLDYRDKKALDLIYRFFHELKKEGLTRLLLEEFISKNSSASEKVSKGLVELTPDYPVGEDDQSTDQAPGIPGVYACEVKGDEDRPVSFPRRFLSVLLLLIMIADVFILAGFIYLIILKGATVPLTAGFIADLLLFMLLQHIYVRIHRVDRQKGKTGDQKGKTAVHKRKAKDYKRKPDDDNSREIREKAVFSYNTPREAEDKRKMASHEVISDTYNNKRGHNVFEELESYWEKGSETVLLSRGEEVERAYLQDTRSDSNIEIKIYPFYIGSEEGLNQLSLKNRAVSRQHAVIFKEEDSYYIEDLDSRNGTKVEGMQVDPARPQRIIDGSRIEWADEVWEFRIFATEF